MNIHLSSLCWISATQDMTVNWAWITTKATAITVCLIAHYAFIQLAYGFVELHVVLLHMQSVHLHSNAFFTRYAKMHTKWRAVGGIIFTHLKLGILKQQTVASRLEINSDRPIL